MSRLSDSVMGAEPAGAAIHWQAEGEQRPVSGGEPEIWLHLTAQACVSMRCQRCLNALAVLRATFPAGTVSGAPKLRAMEIIDELEPTKRGIYAGSVGYLGFHGDMDLAIAIRTAVVKDGMIHVQAGAGIVADSDPQSEWLETQSKARAMLRAAEIAEAGLDTSL